VDTQDIVGGADLGYRPVIEDDHNVVPNPYSREDMAQQMCPMDDTPMYKDADMEWLYSHPKADVSDNETQGVKDPHNGLLVPCRASSPKTLLHKCYVINKFEQ
jgi:hypothetical protein